MNNTTVLTYIDSDAGVDLLPMRTRLVFTAHLGHSPGLSEIVEYRLGPSDCGQYDVLWCSSDWCDEVQTTAVAWLPRHQIKGKALPSALLRALFKAEMAQNKSAVPQFDEVLESRRGLLSSREVREIAEQTLSDAQT